MSKHPVQPGRSQRRSEHGCSEEVTLSRRRLLGGATASLALWGYVPRAAHARARDPRLLTMVLRGGMDGLSLAAPIGDPDYERLRGAISLRRDGPKPTLSLDTSFFGLNPNMPFLKTLFDQRQATIVHAVHTPYRDRSHFDGQDVLESGWALPGRTQNGWLNRALSALPHTGTVDPKGLTPSVAAGTTSGNTKGKTRGLSMGNVVPLIMLGAAPVMSWTPRIYNLPLRDSTVARLMDLYTHTDPALAKAFAEGFEITKLTETSVDQMQPTQQPRPRPASSTGNPAPGGIAVQPVAGTVPPQLQPQARPFREFTEAAEAAAKFLSAADGPRIGALSYNGWDTHANEGVLEGQFAGRLGGLDLAIKTLHDGLGTAWADTVVMIITEFGRTARINGTAGTDHGSATCALLVGGAVKGGRVIADWPGLADGKLFQNRDLAPTLDLRAVLKGVLADHLGIPERALADTVFPESSTVRPMAGLIA